LANHKPKGYYGEQPQVLKGVSELGKLGKLGKLG